MKINTKNLYVACKVYNYEKLIEPWEQYDTFGKIDHTILVYPKKILVIKDEDGKFYDLKTGKELFEKNYSSSGYTNSSCSQNIYLSGMPLGPLYNSGKMYFDHKEREISYLMPISEYLENSLGLKLEDEVSSIEIRTLINLLNIGKRRVFPLSYDETEVIYTKGIRVDGKIKYRLSDIIKTPKKKEWILHNRMIE